MGPTRRLGQLVARYEKIVLAALAVVILLSGSFWFKEYSQSQSDRAAPGGTYVHGIVGGTTEVEAIAAQLTRTGLFDVNESGDLVNRLVDSWQVNDQKTEYQFTLKKDVDAVQIQTDLEENLSVIGPASVEHNGGQQVTLHLSEANPNLPLVLAQPLFRYGAYKVSKTTEKTTIFTRDVRPGAISAYINRVVVHNFGSEAELEQMLKDRKIDGATLRATQEIPAHFERHSYASPRYFTVIVNENKSPFRELAARQALLKGQNPSSIGAFTLTSPAEEPYHANSQILMEKWQGQGAKVTLNEKPLEEVTQKIGPSRDFQALLIGIDLGAELDPYYFWHSSQIRAGNNLAGVKDIKIDEILGQIRGTLNVNSRRELIETLNQALTDQGAALFLEQETASVVVADSIRFQAPWLPISAGDFWQALPQWSVR